MTPKVKATLTILVSFLIGAVAGAAGLRLAMMYSDPKPATPGIVRLETELHNRLGLSADQQAGLDSLLQRRRTVFENFRNQMSGHFRDMRETTRDSIRRILTEEQKPKFELFVRELDLQREKEKGTPR